MGGHIYGYVGHVPYVQGTIMFLLVIFSIIILEMIIQKLEHYAEKYNWDKLFEKLKHELMVLGLISFFIVIIESFNADLTSEWYLAFEVAHITLLFVAFSFIVQAIFLIEYTIIEGKKYLVRISRQSNGGLLNYYNVTYQPNEPNAYDTHHIFKNITKIRFWENVEFKIIEKFFLKHYDLPQDIFDFSAYVSISLHDYIAELGEVSPIGWILVALLIVLNLIQILAIDAPGKCETSGGEEGGHSASCGTYVLMYGLICGIILDIMVFFQFMFTIAHLNGVVSFCINNFFDNKVETLSDYHYKDAFYRAICNIFGFDYNSSFRNDYMTYIKGMHEVERLSDPAYVASNSMKDSDFRENICPSTDYIREFYQNMSTKHNSMLQQQRPSATRVTFNNESPNKGHQIDETEADITTQNNEKTITNGDNKLIDATSSDLQSIAHKEVNPILDSNSDHNLTRKVSLTLGGRKISNRNNDNLQSIVLKSPDNIKLKDIRKQMVDAHRLEQKQNSFKRKFLQREDLRNITTRAIKWSTKASNKCYNFQKKYCRAPENEYDEELNHVFACNSARIYFGFIEFSFLLQCLYFAFYLTHFIPIVVKEDMEAGIAAMWIIILFLPTVIGFHILRLSLTKIILLRSAVLLDREVIGKVCEELYEKEEAIQEVKAQILQNEEMLKFDNSNDRVNYLRACFLSVTEHGENKIKKSAFRDILGKLNVFLSRHKTGM